MDQKEFLKLASSLVSNYRVFTPQENNGRLIISELTNSKKADLPDRLPFYSWKKYFIPENEILFNYCGNKLSSHKLDNNKIALLGINIADLRAISLYDLVFANDPCFQARRENMLIIGFGPEVKLPNGETRKIEEKELAHLPFDIFLFNNEKPKSKTKNYKVFVATKKGEKALKEISYNDFKKIKFLGHKYNDFLKNKMNLRREKLKNQHNQKIWDELGKICLECGKCTIACPTCFCFRINDIPSLEKKCDLQSNGSSQALPAGERRQCWDSCFYQEFSEVAGGHKFLADTAQRIHFWYYHKFARIPDEYNIMGCVGCHRCHAVCPVGINIEEVMKQIEES